MTNEGLDFQAMLKLIAGREGFQPRIARIDQVVRFELSSPQTTITAKFLAKAPPVIEEGAASAAGTVVQASVSDATKILLGELDGVEAYETGRLVVQGHSKALVAVMPDVKKMAAPLCRGALVEPGRPDPAQGLPAWLAIDHGDADRN